MSETSLGDELGRATAISLQHRPLGTSRSTSVTHLLYTMAEPTKAETDQVFKVLKAGKGNKVRIHAAQYSWKMANHTSRCALTARLAVRRGLASRLAYTFVSIVPACTVTWVCISRLFGTPLLLFRKCTLLHLSIYPQGRPTSTVGNLHSCAP